MKRRKLLQALGPSWLLLPLSIISIPGLAAPGMQEVVLGWQLTEARVVDPGVTMTLPQGTLTSRYVLEASATAADPVTPIKKGVFSFELSAFSPRQEMPGQTAGVWYVRGDWRITKSTVTGAEEEARHSPSLVNGSLSVELPLQSYQRDGTGQCPGSPAQGPARWPLGRWQRNLFRERVVRGRVADRRPDLARLEFGEVKS